MPKICNPYNFKIQLILFLNEEFKKCTLKTCAFFLIHGFLLQFCLIYVTFCSLPFHETHIIELCFMDYMFTNSLLTGLQKLQNSEKC